MCPCNAAYKKGLLLKVIFQLAMTTVFTLLFIRAEAQNSQGDYAVYPALRFHYRHLKVDLKMDVRKAVLKGEAVYTLQPYLSGSDEVLMHTYRTDIQSVTMGNRHLRYEIHNDTLHIHLPQAYAPADTFKLDIVFFSQPKFGLHLGKNGLIWTSMLPFTTSHLFPVLDHPRIACPVDMTITVPGDEEVASNGILMDKVKESTGWTSVHWRMDSAIPVTNIKFAVGDFDVRVLKEKHFTLSLYSEKKELAQGEDSGLLVKADSLINQIEKIIHQPFPYHGLTLVVLPDHRWEEKNYAAGFGYLFLNRGNLTGQLRRIIYAQWFGGSQYSSQYAGAAPQLLMQAWLAQKTGEPLSVYRGDTDNPAHPFSIYDIYGTANWTRWRLLVRQSQDTVFKKTLDESAIKIAARKGILNWDDASRIWYSYSGIKYNLPPLPEPGSPDTLFTRFRIKYYPGGRLDIVVDSLHGHRNTLTNLPVRLFKDSGTELHTLTFANDGDTAYSVKIPGLRNVEVTVPDTSAIVVQERKSMNFWLYQLHHANNVALKVRAARALGQFNGDPDLQLALNDAIANDSLPEVKAALIHSMGEIVNGAMGTSDDFITYAKSNFPSVRLSAIEILSRYPGNDNAIDAVQSLLPKEHDTRILNAIFCTLNKIEPDSAYQVMVKEYLRTDTTTADTVTATILSTLAHSHNLSLTDSLASRYLLDSYAGYRLRVYSLRLLGKIDNSRDDWQAIVQNLVADNDPRIRYLAWQYISRLQKKQRTRLINDQLQEEDDIRVLREIRLLAGSGS